MSGTVEHLLAFALGPVQEFILEARRTRDLWFGSALLSRAAAASACALEAAGARLVVPPPVPGGKHGLAAGISNKLLAAIPQDVGPREAAEAARKAAMKVLTDEWDLVRRARSDVLGHDADDRAREQLGTFLEAYAAWVPLGTEEDAFRVARRAVEQLLAGRKALRDFRPWQFPGEGLPKSSLDGARPTVLGKPDAAGASDRHALRIRPGEHLDAVGLLKRAGGRPGQFVPVANVGLAGWIETVESAPGFSAVKDACKSAGMDEIHARSPVAALFPYDAQVFLRSRWAPPPLEHLVTAPGGATSKASLDPDLVPRSVVDAVHPLLSAFGDPSPHVAILVADGDGIGPTIDAIASEQGVRDFASALARFITGVRDIIERDHLGSLVYAGGDDLLAFITPSHALSCAEDLTRAFQQAVDGAATGASSAPAPTLSVGIGIGHVLERMDHLVTLGREALRLAKGYDLPADQRRAAMAIVLEKRAGTRMVWRGRWDSEPRRRLEADAALLAGKLSSSKISEIRRRLAWFPSVRDLTPDEKLAVARLLREEMGRILARAGGGADAVSLDAEAVGLTFDRGVRVLPYEEQLQAVRDWADRMRIAQALVRPAAPGRGSVSKSGRKVRDAGSRTA